MAKIKLNLLDIPLVILAGGKSSRMETDKSLIPFDNSLTLLEYQYEKYREIFKNIYISTKNKEILFSKNKENFIFDNSEVYSAMIALNSIFESLSFDKVFILPIDTPLINLDTIYKILEFSLTSNYQIVIAKDNKKSHNLFGVFDKSIKPKIEDCLKNDIHKINYLIRNLDFHEFYFENNEQFLNINFPQDYEQAKKIINKSKKIN